MWNFSIQIGFERAAFQLGYFYSTDLNVAMKRKKMDFSRIWFGFKLCQLNQEFILTINMQWKQKKKQAFKM